MNTQDNNRVILLENVSVRYQAPEEPVHTFKEYAIRTMQGRIRIKEFLALDHVNLEIRQGEIFGIIGRNGAGKSTLLKVISRVLIPKQGRVWIKGRVSPLLELGAGFHPELTGRENVLLNGSLLGRTHSEILERMDDILEFAELASFIEAPIRSYSSGMIARLGFAVATAWEPEILIVDEVLSVGDDVFSAKSRQRMEHFRNIGTTTLIAAHQLNVLKELCNRVAWVDHGKIVDIGDPKDVIAAYQKK
jgi:ABC-2 type transport system ATP-binding protein/lipopolysaccharide transport system ATP-binding protein